MKFEEEPRLEDKGNVTKLASFDGKKEEFPLWWSKLELTCNMKGCAETLETHIESVLPANDAETFGMSTDKGKAFKKVTCIGGVLF